MRLLLALLILALPTGARAQYADPAAEDGDEEYPDQQAPPDEAEQQYGIGYMGPHPIPWELGAGFCYTEGPHSHDYPPFDEHLFEEQDGFYYFTGDPYDFGYSRTLYWFNGNHPIPGSYGGGFCYISWPHRHAYAAVGIEGFSQVGGYYVYGGAWPDAYYYNRDYYWGYYGGYYRNAYFGNRYYTTRPAPAFAVGRPVRIAAPPGRTFVGVPRPTRIIPHAAPVGPRTLGAPSYGRGATSPVYRSPSGGFGAPPGYPARRFSPTAGVRPTQAAPVAHPSSGARPPAVRAPPPRSGGSRR